MTNRSQSTAKQGVGVGDIAPDFELCDQNGSPVRLSAWRGCKNVVLFFYPKANSAGCTVEACAFRDQYESFADAGAVVVGISMDPVDAQAAFAHRNRLPFTLLADPDGAAARAYGVPNWMGVFRGRVTYVIDREGVIQHVFNSQIRLHDHVKAALKTLKRLS
ncbi:MAG: peroxiredoxin [Anaerolineae bacterium]|nr:peroxiredoxin [Anaerolineae bacterium]MCO6442827.1 peroxiredoxin [Anaerolineae bacterium]MDL1915098.1 peroxiredoxin [Anaerolineae bacterium CFX4]OQY82522.1 MAG: peroxiredoxin [Anaerolineae bacterium UTCFX5]